MPFKSKTVLSLLDRTKEPELLSARRAYKTSGNSIEVAYALMRAHGINETHSSVHEVVEMLKGENSDRIGGPLLIHHSLISNPFELSEESENIIREVVMVWWAIRWSQRRQKLLTKLNRSWLSTKERSEISKERYVKSGEPSDLSGACKIVSQICYVLFHMHGIIFTNKRHAFVVVAGKVYDLNRNCTDVRNMKMSKDRKPYEMKWDVHFSDEAQKGMESWHGAIPSLIVQCEKALSSAGIPYSETGVYELPEWAISTN